MRAYFRNASLVDDNDFVCVPDCGQAVSDYDGGAILKDSAQGFLD